MVNIPIIPPAGDIHTDLLPDITQTWKVGQVLNATVERGGENLDKILLRIGHLLVESKTPLPLKTGEQIKVLVKALGDNPLLSIITQPNTAQIAASHIRPFIQAQQDWRPLLDLAVRQLASQGLPAEVRPVLQTLLRQVPDVEQLSQPASLRQFIQSSGILLEAHLSRHQPVSGDYKAQFQQLQSLLQQHSPLALQTGHPEQALRLIENYLRNPTLSLPRLAQELGALLTPADMRSLLGAIENRNINTPLTTALLQVFAHIQKQQGLPALEQLLKLITEQNNLGELKIAVQNALSHISQQQLMPLLRDADNTLLLLFGLPLRYQDETHWVEFRLERDRKSGASTESGWHVTLNFDIPALGPMQAKLHLFGNRLATTFQADVISTRDKIRQHFPQLQKALANAGIEVIKLDISGGPTDQPGKAVNTGVHILDERA